MAVLLQRSDPDCGCDCGDYNFGCGDYCSGNCEDNGEREPEFPDTITVSFSVHTLYAISFHNRGYTTYIYGDDGSSDCGNICSGDCYCIDDDTYNCANPSKAWTSTADPGGDKFSTAIEKGTEAVSVTLTKDTQTDPCKAVYSGYTTEARYSSGDGAGLHDWLTGEVGSDWDSGYLVDGPGESYRQVCAVLSVGTTAQNRARTIFKRWRRGQLWIDPDLSETVPTAACSSSPSSTTVFTYYEEAAGTQDNCGVCNYAVQWPSTLTNVGSAIFVEPGSVPTGTKAVFDYGNCGTNTACDSDSDCVNPDGSGETNNQCFPSEVDVTHYGSTDFDDWTDIMVLFSTTYPSGSYDSCWTGGGSSPYGGWPSCTLRDSAEWCRSCQSPGGDGISHWVSEDWFSGVVVS